MDREQIVLKIDGQERKVDKGTRYRQIAASYRPCDGQPVLLVLEDNRLRELRHAARQDADVRFLTIRDADGYKAYVRSMTLMMLAAAGKVSQGAQGYGVKVHFTVSDGLYCTLEKPSLLDQRFLQQVKEQMRALTEQALPFEKESLPTDDAARLFRQRNMPDKEQLMRYRRGSRTNVYRLDGYVDYNYGYMVDDTSVLGVFDLQPFGEGFVLRYADQENPASLPPFAPDRKLFAIQNDSLRWGQRLQVETVADLNGCIVDGRAGELILTMEAYQEKKIAEIAAGIADDPGRRVVMIAGPSSSGKTTFSHRLSAQLSVYGLRPHPIPVDDYFKDREHTPKNPDGSYNFECLEAIDTQRFNEDITALLEGKRVEMPIFNFRTGKREYKGRFRQLGQNDILVIEGIHCLNDALSYAIPKENKYKIYISALTQLNLDEHNRIATTDGRLLRRIVRDARTRGTRAEDTIAMWPSVRSGEEHYIFPFQESADVMFNSALIYELSVLKIYAEPLLFGIPRESPCYVEAKKLLKFLEYFVPMPSEQIPNNSLVREFVGGGCFAL